MVTKNIILYGMRWVWKSTLWKLVAEKMWYTFIDLDDYISDKIWQPLSIYIEKVWRDIFRTMEHLCCKEVLKLPWKKIISLWWGTIVFPRNQHEILKNNHSMIFIDAPIDDIIARITIDENKWKTRNALTDSDVIAEIKKIYKERKPIYEEFSDTTISNIWNIQHIVEKTIEAAKVWWICIPVTTFNQQEFEHTMFEIWINNKIKYIELRIDYLEDIKRLPELLSLCTKPTIVTNRHKDEWGNFEWPMKESLHRLLLASESWADYVDIESGLIGNMDIPLLKHIQEESWLILSYHNFSKVDSIELLKKNISRMVELWADVCKIACNWSTKDEVDIMYDIHKRSSTSYPEKESIYIAMWEIWRNTRIDMPKKWALLTFATLWNYSSAPGQIPLDEVYTHIYS